MAEMEKEIEEKYMLAGKIAARTLKYATDITTQGKTLLDVTEKIEEKIISLGGEFAFPPQISLNDVAAHYCSPADDKTEFKEDDVIKIDLGVHIDGYVADNAATVVIGNNEKLKLLAEASRAALNSAIKIVKPGVKVNEIGKAIEHEIKSRGFTPVINLSGHGLGRFIIHDNPSIPNFNTGTATLKEDQVIAIEPFASTGAGMIYESSNATIYAIEGTRAVRSPMTREVLKTIEGYKGLPFTQRWLMKKHGPGKTLFALKELRNLGILKEYPPLPDKSHGIVSQAEHTIIVRDKPIITTLFEE
jgi:methionyl aminopeptidase